MFLSTVTILLIIMIAPCLRQTPLKTAQGYCRGLDKTAQDRKATTKARVAALAVEQSHPDLVRDEELADAFVNSCILLATRLATRTFFVSNEKACSLVK